MTSQRPSTPSMLDLNAKRATHAISGYTITQLGSALSRGITREHKHANAQRKWEHHEANRRARAAHQSAQSTYDGSKREPWPPQGRA